MKKTITVIGGGPAGMMAAIAAAEYGGEQVSVTLLEKNEKLGKKIYITGKGRCNFTNACNTEDFFANVVSNSKFLYSAIYGFDSTSVMDFIESNGTPVKVERGMRAFPVSDHASDITKALSKALDRLGVCVKLNAQVTEILREENGSFCVLFQNQKSIHSDKLILATGGLSYKSTGSTGDGHRFSRRLGLCVLDKGPGLVPLIAAEEDVKRMQGLSLKNIGLTAYDEKGKKLYDDFGEMLFTHFGVSGPMILTLSSRLGAAFDAGRRITVTLDLKPALTESVLDERLLREIGEKQNKQFGNFFEGILPQKMIPVFLERLHIPLDLKVNSITRQMRMDMIHLMKNFSFTVIGSRGYDEAIITRGGVDVRELDPSTMEAKKIPGLYLAGELIDVDAVTGGFNMQIAFSTGHLAGMSAALE